MPKLFYIGVKGIVCAGGKCLLLKNALWENPFWDVPGGRMEEGETVEQTLARELSEELPSLTTYRVDRMLGAYPYPENLKDGNGLFFLAFKVVAEPFEVVLSPEHSDYRWVAAAEVVDADLGVHTAAIRKAFE